MAEHKQIKLARWGKQEMEAPAVGFMIDLMKMLSPRKTLASPLTNQTKAEGR